jgi:hypothetical protein
VEELPGPCNVASRFSLIRSSFGSGLTESCFWVKLNPFVGVDPVRPFRRCLRTLDLHSRGYYSCIVKTGMAKSPSLILDDPGALRILQGFLSVILSRVCWAGAIPNCCWLARNKASSLMFLPRSLLSRVVQRLCGLTPKTHPVCLLLRQWFWGCPGQSWLPLSNSRDKSRLPEVFMMQTLGLRPSFLDFFCCS